VHSRTCSENLIPGGNNGKKKKGKNVSTNEFNILGVRSERVRSSSTIVNVTHF
jgi:hypothetical protein